MINTIKVAFVLFIIFLTCVSCTSRKKASLPVKDSSYVYFINYPNNWNYFDYGTDGDVIYEKSGNSVAPLATIIKGNNLDAKISIFLFKKNFGKKCVLSGEKSEDYDEDNLNKKPNIYFNNNQIMLADSVVNKWYNDSESAIRRIYFSVDDNQCILFMLTNKINQKQQVGNDFYKIVSSLRRVEKQ